MSDFAREWANRHDGACEGHRYRNAITGVLEARLSGDWCHCYRRWLEGRLGEMVRFLDYEVRSWLPSEHTNCGIGSGCAHAALERDMFEKLDAQIFSLLPPKGAGDE